MDAKENHLDVTMDAKDNFLDVTKDTTHMDVTFPIHFDVHKHSTFRFWDSSEINAPNFAQGPSSSECLHLHVNKNIAGIQKIIIS